jgi:murein DD-endopeptidase MepM/ murein hydrolase activator NlpD
VNRAAALAVLCALAGPGCAHVSDPSATPYVRRNPCEGKLGLSRREEGTRIAVDARNDCHVPVVLVLSFELDNLRPSRALPAEVALAPGQHEHVVDLVVVRQDRPSGYRAASSVRVGGEPRPDPSARYAFPFGGDRPRKLSQGTLGGPTHQGIHRYSFDFELPIGTPVLAARDGVVFQVQDGYGEGGAGVGGEHGNLVVIWHADGTFGLYGHLREGVCAREGEAVRAGDFLAWSGNSGYTTGPHLHFGVGIAAGENGEIETLPILFTGEVVPEEGGLYGPGPTGARAAPPGSRCDGADGRDS